MLLIITRYIIYITCVFSTCYRNNSTRIRIIATSTSHSIFITDYLFTSYNIPYTGYNISITPQSYNSVIVFL